MLGFCPFHWLEKNVVCIPFFLKMIYCFLIYVWVYLHICMYVCISHRRQKRTWDFLEVELCIGMGSCVDAGP